MKSLLILSLCTAAAWQSCAAAPGCRTFALDIRNGKPVVSARGDKTMQTSGQVKIAKEKDGSAYFLFAKKGDFFRFSQKGNIQAEQGTVAFFVKECDTAPDQRVWNPYFQWPGREEVFAILRLWQPFEVGGGLWNKRTRLVWSFAETPKQGVWRHIAFSWQKRMVRLYIDGKERQTLIPVDFLFRNPGNFFTVGRPSEALAAEDDFHTGRHILYDAPQQAEKMKIGKEPYGAIGIRSFRIFDRPLTPEEAAALAAGKELPKQAEDQLSVHYDEAVSARTLRVVVTSLLAKEGDRAQIRLRDSAGKIIAQISAVAEKGGFAPATLKYGNIPAGKYNLEATLARTGAKGGATFRKLPDFPWVGNKLGSEDVVLPGFEPLKAGADSASVWGRTYHFEKSLMPQRIVNQSCEVLAEPIRWTLADGGKESLLTFSKIRRVSATPTRAVWEGEGSLGKLKVTGKVTVEYDGFMDYSLTFTPPAGGMDAESLRMEIPFRPEEATLLFHEARRSATWENNWKSPVTPLGSKGVITIGNPDRCLQWMIESDQFYYPEDNPNTLQCLETAGKRIFRIEVIGAKKKITSPSRSRSCCTRGPSKRARNTGAAGRAPDAATLIRAFTTASITTTTGGRAHPARRSLPTGSRKSRTATS